MQHHILITCGTSQIDREKIGRLELSIATDQLNEFLDEAKSSSSSVEALYKKHRNIANAIIQALVDRKDMLTSRSTVDSPFGGEISTLYELKYLNGWDNWKPNGDTYVIFTSETGPGYFCAQVLRSLLIHSDFCGVPSAQVSPTPVIIEGLIDEPSSEADAQAAMISLAKKISENLVRSNNPSEQQKRNVFVMTGGYKSIIPCLTLYSLFYGIELVYLFEHAPFAQSLFPNIAFERKEWQLWKNACDRLLQMNDRNDCLQYILSELPDSPEVRF